MERSRDKQISEANRQISFLIPILEDWEAVSRLLSDLDSALLPLVGDYRVYIVDDGSASQPPDSFFAKPWKSLAAIQIISLRCNVGHQRALAIGLAYVEKNCRCDALVVMDGDGEDAPADALKLIEQMEQEKHTRIVFAARARRSENIWFKTGYFFFRIVHRVLLGRPIRIGNFSVIPSALLRKTVYLSNTWNHYAAAIIKSRIPISQIPVSRAKRLVGESRMNFVSLVMHGLSAISVQSDILGVRLLIACFIGATSSIIGAVGLALSFPTVDWRLFVAAQTIFLFTSNLLVCTGFFVFATLSSRNSATFIPARDFALFVDSYRSVFDVRTTHRLEKAS